MVSRFDQLLTEGLDVRTTLEEPNIPTWKSAGCWLTASACVSRENGQKEREGSLSGEQPGRLKRRHWKRTEGVSHVLCMGMHFWLTETSGGLSPRPGVNMVQD
jgi:hypothetical protein